MPSFRSLGNKFFGNTISTAAGVAAGGATARTLDPALQDVTNRAWEKHPVVPPDAYALAEGVAQGQVSHDAAYHWAKQQGLDKTQMDALVNIASGGPGLGYAFEAWRRGFLTDDEFTTALHRTGLEPAWFDALRQLKQNPLDPADVARGIHKSLIPDPGLLASPQPSGVGNVPAYPVYKINAVAEAEAAGIDRERLGVLVGLQGNPMGAHEAAQAVFRGVLKQADYDRAIAEGNTRNEWGEAIMEQTRQIPTARDFIENALRGYITFEEALAGAARHGMTREDATLIYQNDGRPMNLHQITTGLARGGTFKPEPGEITDPFMASIVEGSLKPAYYDLALANRYTLPGYFVIKAMLADGTLSRDEAAKLFEQSGWPPDLAAKAAKALGATGAKKASPYVTRAQGYLFTAIHKHYTNKPYYIDRARAGMTMIGIAAADQDEILKLFAQETHLTEPVDGSTP